MTKTSKGQIYLNMNANVMSKLAPRFSAEVDFMRYEIIYG
jgi:hypothetical protein